MRKGNEVVSALHGIVDGKSAMMRVLASMNQDPGARRIEPFFAVDLTSERPKPPPQLLEKIVSLQAKLRTQASAVTSLYLGVRFPRWAPASA